MAASLHAGLIMVVIGTIATCLALYGRRPQKARTILLAFYWSFFMTLVIGGGFLTIMVPEGPNSNLPILLFVGTLLTLTFIEPKKLRALLTLFVVMTSIMLSAHHLVVAQTAQFTDNPTWRIKRIERRRQREAKSLVSLHGIKVVPAWHTWFTNLYEVSPPAGGRDFASSNPPARETVSKHSFIPRRQ